MPAKNPRPPLGVRLTTSSFTTFASRLAPTGSSAANADSVGAGLPAKKPRPPRGIRLIASSLTTFASRLAPTGSAADHKICGHHRSLVGASLLAMRASATPHSLQRWQASSHRVCGQPQIRAHRVHQVSADLRQFLGDDGHGLADLLFGVFAGDEEAHPGDVFRDGGIEDWLGVDAAF